MAEMICAAQVRAQGRLLVSTPVKTAFRPSFAAYLGEVSEGPRFRDQSRARAAGWECAKPRPSGPLTKQYPSAQQEDFRQASTHTSPQSHLTGRPHVLSSIEMTVLTTCECVSGGAEEATSTLSLNWQSAIVQPRDLETQ